MTESDGRFYLLIPRVDGEGCLDALFLMPDGDGWKLPSVTGPLRFRRAHNPSILRSTIREELGLDTTALLWLARSQEPTTQRYQFLAVLEFHETVGSGGGAWQGAGVWSSVTLPDEPLETAFRNWLVEASAGTAPSKRVPWALPGWLVQVTSWIDDTLAGQDITRTGPIEQERTWSISCMLRVPSTAGDFYYKAVPKLFAREPRLTAALAAAYPGEVPDVAGVDEERHGMLMRAFSGLHLEDSDSLSKWQGALRRYAQIQQESAADYEQWYALGCSDRRLPVLISQIDELLADRAALEAGDRLAADEIQALRDLVPHLKVACRELEALGLPYTLEHGDLHANNILVTGGGYLFFDWTDGCITHPFFCLLPFLETAPEPSWHEALIEAYLDQWQAYLPTEALRRAMALARPLGALHIAISYWDIRNVTEPALHWELEGGIAIFLRQVLRLQDELVLSTGGA